MWKGRMYDILLLGSVLGKFAVGDIHGGIFLKQKYTQFILTVKMKDKTK